jgi:hypothetical protein
MIEKQMIESTIEDLKAMKKFEELFEWQKQNFGSFALSSFLANLAF